MSMIQIYNAEPALHRVPYYATTGVGANEALISKDLNLLPGLNYVEAEIVEKAGINAPTFPGKGVLLITDMIHVPENVALDMLDRSASISALSLWRMSEKRPALIKALDKKIERRRRALKGESVPEGEQDNDGNA